MNTKVTSIHSAASSLASEQALRSARAGPNTTPEGGLQQLLHAVVEAGFIEDLKSIWSAYPNLEEATGRLLSRITFAWPSREKACSPAIALATIKAVKAVKRSIASGERSRTHVVGAYLGGLSSVAEDVACVRVWGYCKDNTQKLWTVDDADLAVWIAENGFTDVKFFTLDETSQNEITGTRMKLLCAIASTRDVGLVGRFH